MSSLNKGPETHTLVVSLIFILVLGFILAALVLISSGQSDKSTQILTAPTTPASTCKDSVLIVAMSHSEHTCPVGSRIGVERLPSGSILATCTCPPKPVEAAAPTPAALDEAEPACE